MIKPEIAARLLRDAEWQVAHGNPKGAIGLYKRLFKAGNTDMAAFGRYRALHRSVHGEDLPHGEVFDFIYSANVWGGASEPVGTSGKGSGAAVTEPYRNFLAAFLKEKWVASVLDVGCGDWQLASRIDWTGIGYTGLDVSAVVLRNTKRYASKTVSFIEGDARTVDLPPADLLILKDVLQHWSNGDILGFLPKLAAFRYALVTNGGDPVATTDINRDVLAGGFRLVDLSAPPFSVAGKFVFAWDVSLPQGDGTIFREHKRVFLVEGGGA